MPECPKCGCGCPPRSGDVGTPVPQPDEPPAQPVFAKKQGAKEGRTNVAAATNAPPSDPCWCAIPNSECYKDHYNGICACNCADCDCDSEWVVLAALKDTGTDEAPSWKPDHSVRRFVRPVLMRDPVAWEEVGTRRASHRRHSRRRDAGSHLGSQSGHRERRSPAAAIVHRSPVAAGVLPPGQALQQRLGNQGTQALISRAVAGPAPWW